MEISASQPSFGRITRPFLQDIFPSSAPQTPDSNWGYNWPVETKLKCSYNLLHTTMRARAVLSRGSQNYTWFWFLQKLYKSRKAPLTLPGVVAPLRAEAVV